MSNKNFRIKNFKRIIFFIFANVILINSPCKKTQCLIRKLQIQGFRSNEFREFRIRFCTFSFAFTLEGWGKKRNENQQNLGRNSLQVLQLVRPLAERSWRFLADTF